MGALTRILVAEDESEIRILLQRLLVHEGFEVELAANGQEALELARADPPDILLLDLLMPVMGGLDACRRIRMDPSIGRLPVILMSGKFAELEEGLVFGPDDYISKPFAPHDILARIRRLAQQAGSQGDAVSIRGEDERPDGQAIMVVDDDAAIRKLIIRSLKRFYPLARFAQAAGLDEAKSPRCELKGMALEAPNIPHLARIGVMATKALVVDDDRAILGMIKRHLTAGNISCVVTDNGSEALMLVRESRPDIILVDAEMPGLDGHSVCRVLKKEAATRNIPVIIMSGARINEKEILAGFQGGADDYVLKPFSVPVLMARMQAVLRRYKNSSQSEEKLKQFGIELDPAGRTVKVGGKDVPMTRKEFDLLATLIAKAGRLLSIPYLLETVWGYDPADYNDPGTVEVHICHLRKKLGPKLARRIVAVIGHGYKFEA